MGMRTAPEVNSEVDLIRALFGGKWRFDVVRNLCVSPQRLSTLGRCMPNARKKVLIDTLHALEDLGWIRRSDLSPRNRSVEYSLSGPWKERIELAVRRITNESDTSHGTIADQKFSKPSTSLIECQFGEGAVGHTAIPP
ncbi:helix-turn-helix domain-containing protein [Acidipila sp. EB88]|uniref:winged helix-turn-helix transcriptional regulator n=1 Tax=Acidipila sp. EB88 TaxID=2305226 RepID=UPI000F5F0DED|nr:transcriptional regulator [Acidipila sp. EB88]